MVMFTSCLICSYFLAYHPKRRAAVRRPTTISNQENYHGQNQKQQQKQEHFNLTNGFFIVKMLSTFLQHLQFAVAVFVALCIFISLLSLRKEWIRDSFLCH